MFVSIRRGVLTYECNHNAVVALVESEAYELSDNSQQHKKGGYENRKGGCHEKSNLAAILNRDRHWKTKSSRNQAILVSQTTP
jgi:hypothetical protein